MISSFRLLLLVSAVAVSVISFSAQNLLGMLVALVMLWVAFRREAQLTSSGGHTSSTFILVPTWRGRLSAHAHRVWGAASTLAALGASLISARDPYSLLANYLWLASLLLLLIAAAWHDGLRLALPRSLRVRLTRTQMRELLLVGGVTALGFALRVYDLEHFPPSVHGDEGEIGQLARRVLEGQQPIPLWGTLWSDLPTMLYYFKALSLAAFGDNIVGLRMLSVIVGTASVPLLYALARIGWGPLAAFTAAWLMSVSHLHIQYSRLALNIVEVAAGMLAVMLLLAIARERAGAQPLLLYTLAGLLMGLSQYIYFGARLMPLVVAVLLLYQWRERRVTRTQIAVVALASFIAFAPMAAFYLNHPHLLQGRTDTVNIFRAESVRHTLGPNAQLPQALLPLFAVQIERTLGFLLQYGDDSGFYLQDLSPFDSITALLAWLGLGVVLTRARRYHEFALLLLFVSGLFVAGVLTIDPPAAQRLLIMVPMVYLLGGVFVARGWPLLAHVLRLAPQQRWLITPLLLGLCALTLYINLQMYFVAYARAAPNLVPIFVSRELNIAPENYQAYLFGRPNLVTNHGVIRYVARDAQASDPQSIDEVKPPADGRGLLVIALANHLEDLRALQTRFPGGTLTTISDPMGRLLYAAYRVPPKR